MKKKTAQQNTEAFSATDIFVGLLLLAMPLSTLFQDYSVIARSKFLTLVVISVFSLAVILFRVIKKKEKLIQKKIGITEFALGLYVFFSAISTVLSPYRADAFLGATRYEGLASIVLYALIFLAVSQKGEPKAWMVCALGIAATAFSFIAFMQFSGRNPLGLFPNGLTYQDAGYAYEGVYLSTIGNADVAGAFVCLVIPTLLLYIIFAKKDFWRFFLILPLCMTIAVWAKMEVTAAVVGVLAGMILALPFSFPKGKARKALLLGIGGAAIAAILIVTGFDIGDGILHEAHEILHGRAEDSYASSRVWVWSETWKVAKEHLLFGTGPDTLVRYGVDKTVYNPTLNINIVARIDVAHNEFFNILTQQGIFALLSYLTFLGTLFYRWTQSASTNRASAVCGTAAICYFVQAMFGMSACATTPLLMIALAMI